MATTATEHRIERFFLYGEPAAAWGERLLHIETIAVRSARYDWRIRPHMHAALHQLLFVAKGRVAAIAEDTLVRHRAPALIVVPAGTVHGFEFEPETEGYVLSITDDLLQDLARREAGIGRLFDVPMTLACSRSAVGDLEHMFAAFAQEFERRDPARMLALEGWLAVVLARVLRLSQAFERTCDADLRRRRALVARFRELIARNLGEGKTIAEYAAALYVSESQLRKACLSVAEQSPIKLVHGRVLLEAKRQLLYTSKPVSEIAYALGFDDPAYFTRFFSRRTGMSPRAYRARGPASLPA
ncbi:MAG TPA: helix-turn-helix domain-containing protein [Gammaproteobacteria bacterium]